MSEPFSFLGWGFTWHQHTCQSTTQNLNKPKFTTEAPGVREMIYDEWAEYAFHFKARRIDPHARLYIRAVLLPEGKRKPVYLSKINPVDDVDPREPYWQFDPSTDSSDPKDTFWVRLFWPSRYKNYHTRDNKFQFQADIGWKGGSEANSIPPKFTLQLPVITFSISDVIPK